MSLLRAEFIRILRRDLPRPSISLLIRFSNYPVRHNIELSSRNLYTRNGVNMLSICQKPCFAALLLAIVAFTAPAQPKATFSDQSSTKELFALFDSEWERTLKNSPTFASYLGDKRYNDRWDDVSLANLKQNDELNKQALARLKKIDRSKLSTADRLNYDLFQKDLETAIELFQHRLYLAPITQRGGIQTADELTEVLSFETVKDYEDWLARLNAFPKYMEQTIALLREGQAQGIVWSRLV